MEVRVKVCCLFLRVTANLDHKYNISLKYDIHLKVDSEVFAALCSMSQCKSSVLANEELEIFLAVQRQYIDENM